MDLAVCPTELNNLFKIKPQISRSVSSLGLFWSLYQRLRTLLLSSRSPNSCRIQLSNKDTV